LGLVGLAGAWPALTPRLRTSVWDRAALAAVGWLWLLLAAPLAGIDLYTRRPRGTPAPDVWTASLSVTVHDVVGPIFTSGALAGALVWALAAIVLPWIARGRALAVDLVLVTVWAATTVTATEVAIAIIGRAHDVSAPPSAVAGAVASGAVALSPALLRAWRVRAHGVNPQPELP